ncbi:MAG: protein kinase [Planctomycetota bacterium]
MTQVFDDFGSDASSGHEEENRDEQELPNDGEVIDSNQPADDATRQGHDSQSISEVLGFDIDSITPKEESDRDAQHAVGEYVLRRRLGEGGFGHVFLADHPRLGISVAVKLARPSQFSRPTDSKQFVDEARIAASLRHPGIVTVHDVDSIDGLYFIVQEYLPGGTLADRIRPRGMEPDSIGKYLIPIAEALAFAHQKGIYHRDVKPVNVLFDMDDRPKVTDFGLATRHASRQKSEGLRVGTPHYMSPEQVRGEANRTNGRSDIWALGVMLYLMLTGKRPFKGKERHEIYRSVLYSDPVTPRQIRPDIPLSLQRICMKCLEKMATDRYASATDLANDLRHSIAELERHRLGTGVAFENGSDSSNSSEEPPIVPKFLRPYDRHDQDAYPRLLPGPFDVHGLPESIRFWKNWIETSRSPGVARTTQSPVAFLYGPSGSGKSSLLRAGLIPRVEDGSRIALIESSREHTEDDVLRELRRIYPLLPEGASLTYAIASLRESDEQFSQPKTIVILDQFEQWLHGNELEMSSPDAVEMDLVGALRNCDGKHVRFLLVVRDDFSMALNRLCRLIEIRMVEGENFRTIDRFDLRHSRRVLIELGRGYGNLPATDEAMTVKHERFIDESLRMISEGGRVVSVRLSLLAHIVRDRDWNESTLRSMGGAEGIGIEFLDETFVQSGGNPKYRLLATPAIRVLTALLPEAEEEASRIKGRRRSRDELFACSGVDEEEFAEVIEMLDRELGLITPTDAVDVMLSSYESNGSTILSEDTRNDSRNFHETAITTSRPETSELIDRTTESRLDDTQAGEITRRSESVAVEVKKTPSSLSETSEAAPQYFQLTHDFLVPTLQQWIARRQTSTRGGRWQLRLERAAERHSRHPARRLLPTIYEHLQYRFWTKSRERTATQNRFLAEAMKRDAVYAGVTCVLIAFVIGFAYRYQTNERIKTLVALWAASAPERWDDLTARTENAGADAKQEIVQRWEAERNKTSSTSQLSLAYAAAPDSDSAKQHLENRWATVSPSLIPKLVRRTGPHEGRRDSSLESARRFPDSAGFVRWCCIAIQQDPAELAWLNTATSPEQNTFGSQLLVSLTRLSSVECEQWGEVLQPAWETLWPMLANAVEDSRAPNELTSVDSGFKWPERQRENLARLAILFSRDSPERLLETLSWADNINRQLLFDELEERFPPEKLLEVSNQRFRQAFEDALPQWPLRQSVQSPRSDDFDQTAARSTFQAFGGDVCATGAWVLNANWSDLEKINEAGKEHGLGMESLRPYGDGHEMKFAATWSRSFQPWTTDQSPFDSYKDLSTAHRDLREQGFALIDFSRSMIQGTPKWFGLWVKTDSLDSILIEGKSDSASEWKYLVRKYEHSLEKPLSVVRALRGSDRKESAIIRLFHLRPDATASSFGFSRSRGSDALGNLYPGRFMSDFHCEILQLEQSPSPWLTQSIPEYRSKLKEHLRRKTRSVQPYRLRLARMESWIGNHADAFELIRDALEDDPGRADFLALDAMIAIDANELERAIEARERFANVVSEDDSRLRLIDLRIALLEDDKNTAQQVINAAPDEVFVGENLGLTPTETAFQQGCWYAVSAMAYGNDSQEQSAAITKALEKINAPNIFNYVTSDPKWNLVRGSREYNQWIIREGRDRQWHGLWTNEPSWQTEFVHSLAPVEFVRRAEAFATDGFRPTVIQIDPAKNDQQPRCYGVFAKPRLLPGWWEAHAINTAILLARLGSSDQLESLLVGKHGVELRMGAIDAVAHSGLEASFIVGELEIAADRSKALGDGEGKLTCAWLMALSHLPAISIPKAGIDLVRNLADGDGDPGIASTARFVMDGWPRDVANTKLTREVLIDPPFKSPEDVLANRGFANLQRGRWTREPSGGRLLDLEPPDVVRIGSPSSNMYYGTSQYQLPYRIPRTYQLGSTEFSRGQFNWLLQDRVFREFCGEEELSQDSVAERLSDRRPLTDCSYLLAIAICQRLSELASIPADEQCFPGIFEHDLKHWEANEFVLPKNVLSRTGYRLPTQAEWEYACRADHWQPFHFGARPRWLGKFASTIHNSGERPVNVASYWPSVRGFFDLHGNVMEWTIDSVMGDAPVETRSNATILDSGFAKMFAAEDGWRTGHPKSHILRGGSFRQSVNANQISYKASSDVETENIDHGFRIARTLSVKETASP